MSKVLVLGDLHLCDTPPVKVLDKSKSHRDGWKALQASVVQSITAVESEIRVLPGDLFHRPSPGPASMRHLHEVMTNGSGAISTIWTLGQHDVPHHDVSSWRNHMVGVVISWVEATIGGSLHGPQNATDSFARCYAWGDDWNLDQFPECEIISAHKSVGNDQSQAAAPTSLHYGNALICAFGDIHSGITPVQVGDTMVLNPGPLLPTSRADLSRFGYAYLVYADFKRGVVEGVEEVDLLGHLRPSTVDWLVNAMDTKEIPDDSDNKTLGEIMDEVRSLRSLEVSDESRIEQIAHTLGTPDRVVQYIQSKLQTIQ